MADQPAHGPAENFDANAVFVSVPFSDSDVLEAIGQRLQDEGYISGYRVLPGSTGYRHGGTEVQGKQYELCFVLLASVIPADREEIIDWIEKRLRDAGWENPLIEITPAKVNPRFIEYLEQSDAEAGKLRQTRKRLRFAIVTLLAGLVLVAGERLSSWSTARAVRLHQQAVMRRVADLQKGVEEKVLAIDRQLNTGQPLTREEPDIFGEPTHQEIWEILRDVRAAELELRKMASDK